MQLNLPILDQLKDAQNILIAGAGGGFDVFIGLPLYFALKKMGKTVHLANYSFCDLDLSKRLMNDHVELLKDQVLGVRGTVNFPFIYFPEGYLAQWFKETHNEDVLVWMFTKCGSAPLKEAYLSLLKHLGKIDALILTDGGVDSLMRGDESGPGTLLEDTISLAAVADLDIPIKLLVCSGFGTEVEEAVCHHHALENIAGLTKIGGFLGSCSLLPQMEEFQFFEAACRYVWEQPDHHRSHISTRIIPAVHGEFGDFHMYRDNRHMNIFISPLMSLYWFFDANKVIERSFLVPLFKETRSIDQALRILMDFHDRHQPIRPRKNIPY